MVAEGTDANFTCSSSLPAEIVWAFNVVSPLPGNAEVLTLTPAVSMLWIRGASLSNAGSYYCKGTFAGGMAATAYANLVFIGKMFFNIGMSLAVQYYRMIDACEHVIHVW